jgi:putative transposase
MMIDQEVVAASRRACTVCSPVPACSTAGTKAVQEGTGFVQPLRTHEHWHIDVSYLNLGGTFYYLCSILDGAMVHWEIASR